MSRGDRRRNPLATTTSSEMAASTSAEEEAAASSVIRSLSFSANINGMDTRRSGGNTTRAIMPSSSSGRSATSTRSNTTANNAIRLEGVAWKRRSGFGKLSGTVGVGKSWERRRLVLHANRKLCYYALDSPSTTAAAIVPNPRGTLDLVPERATISATHINDATQPTPYCLSIKTTDGISPETTKWKLCLDDRKSQMAWLVALTDVVVEDAVRCYNANTLSSAGGSDVFGGEHGGFHRLYEEGEGGMFDRMRHVLLKGAAGGNGGGDDDDKKKSNRIIKEADDEVIDGKQEEGEAKQPQQQQLRRQRQRQQQQQQQQRNTDNTGSYTPMESFVDMTKNTVGDGASNASDASISDSTLSVAGQNAASVQDDEAASSAAAAAAGTAAATAANSSSISSKTAGVYLPNDRLYHALAVVNLSVIYSHVTASSTSVLVISWWQVLLAVNICFCMCLAPTSSSTREEKVIGEKKDEDEYEGQGRRSRTVEVITSRNERLDVSPSDDMEDGDGRASTSRPKFTMTKSSGTEISLTKSMIGAELLREEEVPLSEVPMEMKAKADQVEGLRVEPLSEEEIGAHLHERWALSAADVDLSGSWTLQVDNAFKTEYDTYLKDLGFNRITRGVACSLIGRTSEITKQSEGGRVLYLKGINPKGAWERTLIASGYPDFETHSTKREGADYRHMRSSIKTADAEDVEAEAWWEDRGTVHRSWLRGGTKYGGGDHESRRYLEDDGQVLVCESVFHPRDISKKSAIVTWRFQRNEGESSHI